MSQDLWRRRDLVAGAGWAAIGLALAGGSVAFLRFLFRRAPIEPPSVFSAGPPAEYRPGTVSDRFLKSWRVFLVRTETQMFALHGRCTHLGCTPRWLDRDDKFKCPCHGSGFTNEGINFEGPAPRPLDRARIWLAPDGEVRVDVSRRYPHVEWGDPDAAITFS